MMDEVKQRFSTSTVIIVIILLAIFIVVPPLARVFYAEDKPNKVVDKDDKEQNEDLRDETISCNIDYPNASLKISLVATYKTGIIDSNVLTFTNPNGYVRFDQIQSVEGQEEFQAYDFLLSSFNGLDANHISTQNNITVVTLDQELFDSLGEEEQYNKISDHFGDPITLQGFYESNGFTCIKE